MPILKPKYNKQVHADVVEALYEGLFRKHAAALAGISDDSLAHWVKEGEAGVEKYVQFALDVNRAEAELARIHSRRVVAASEPLDPDAAPEPESDERPKRRRAADWRASAWFLERRFAGLYGNRTPEPKQAKPLPAKQPAADGDARVKSPWPLPDEPIGSVQ